MLNFFFSFHGRVRRTNYFLGALATGIVAWTFGASWLFSTHWAHWSFDDYGARSWMFWPWAPGLGLVAAAVALACFWAQLALAAKRWHDMGATGWLALLSLVPFGHLVIFLILCLVPPTPGSNQYGPDPRPATQPA